MRTKTMRMRKDSSIKPVPSCEMALIICHFVHMEEELSWNYFIFVSRKLGHSTRTYIRDVIYGGKETPTVTNVVQMLRFWEKRIAALYPGANLTNESPTDL